jgi:AcrR family transcriptional regulator
MKESKDLSTHEKIIRQATELFIKHGASNVSLAEIAMGVKISTPAIYRHFKSLDDLILEACKYWVLESKKFNREDERELKSGAYQINQYIVRHMDYTYQHRSHFSLLLGVYDRAMTSPEMLELYRQIKAGALAKLHYILELGNIDGSWKIANSGDMAESIHSLVIAEIFKALIDPKVEKKEDRKKRLLEMMKLLLPKI